MSTPCDIQDSLPMIYNLIVVHFYVHLPSKFRVDNGSAQLARMDPKRKKKKKKKCTFPCSMKNEKSPKMISCGPSNFESEGFHVKLLLKSRIFGSSSFFIHITYYGKVANFQNFVAGLKWSWNQEFHNFPKLLLEWRLYWYVNLI